MQVRISWDSGCKLGSVCHPGSAKRIAGQKQILAVAFVLFASVHLIPFNSAHEQTLPGRFFDYSEES